MKMSISTNTCIKDEGVMVMSVQHETLSRGIETTDPDFDKNSSQWLLCLSDYFSSPAAYKQIASSCEHIEAIL